MFLGDYRVRERVSGTKVKRIIWNGEGRKGARKRVSVGKQFRRGNGKEGRKEGKGREREGEGVRRRDNLRESHARSKV
jgi:hypothetical protein